MISMRHCWYDIGVEFEVDTDFLDYIKGTHQNDGDACLTDTIAEWLKNGWVAGKFKITVHAT